jgi:hypothetical protein
MAITYNWIVSQLECYPEYEGQTDVVTVVHWRCDGTDGEYTAGVYGSVGLTLDPEDKFTPYADLTEAQVIGWVKDALGADEVQGYEKSLENQIEALANPPIVTPLLPWK